MNMLSRHMPGTLAMRSVQIGNMTYTPAQLDLIWKRAAKDCNPSEFEQFMHVCGSMKIDPLRKQAYALVYSKDDEKKRQMTIIVGIDGYRVIAKRSGNYRPDNRAPRVIIDPDLVDPLINPQGLVSAEVSVWMFAHGEWFEVPHTVEWTAFAPIVKGGDDGDYEWVETGEVWPDSGKPKMKKKLKQGVQAVAKLDPSKTRWTVDPKGMLAKCAEAGAIRKAFPDDFSGTYTQDEMDRADVIDLTASEAAEAAAIEDRLIKVHGKDTLLFDMMNDDGLHPIALGKLHDECEMFLRVHGESLEAIDAWKERNKYSLQQFWAARPADALDIKTKVEKAIEAAKAKAAKQHDEVPA